MHSKMMILLVKSAIFSGNLDTNNKLNCVISYGDALSPLAAWYKQLWNESLGKDAKGTFLLSGKGSLDQHSQLQMWLDGAKYRKLHLFKS